MGKSTVFALVKMFEKREYADAFVRGELYMNSLAYFREYKDERGELRGDPHEGLGAIYQPSQIGEIRFGDIRIPPEELAGPVLVRHERLDHAKVFCSYALNSRGFDNVSAETLADFKRVMLVHESCYGLGSIAVLVSNVTKFFERIDSSIRAADLRGYRSLIDYFDENTFHGNFGERAGFHKRKLYSNQREYRVMVERPEPSTAAYTLSVGDLSDIAHITTPEEFNRDLKLTLPDGSSA